MPETFRCTKSVSIGGNAQVGESQSDADPDTLLLEALEAMSVSKAAKEVAKVTGLDRQTLYSRAVELRGE